jgi:hypothetical protein
MAEIKHWDSCTLDEQIERFERAVRVMQIMKPHVRAKHFKMSEWGSRTKCGTVACAAGHCALDPWFRKQGLTLRSLDKDFACPRFFGSDANNKIFVSDELYDLSGKRGHAAALKRLRTYLSYLKAEKAIEDWT